MKGQALLVIGVIVTGAIIALAIAQGNVNFTYQNITTNFSTGSVAWTNVTGYPGVINLPMANTTYAGTTLPWQNITGYGGVVNLPMANTTYAGTSLPWSNITYPGATIPAGNITNATVFGNYNFTFQGNISLLTTNKICLNSGCSQWILGNATGIWIQG